MYLHTIIYSLYIFLEEKTMYSQIFFGGRGPLALVNPLNTALPISIKPRPLTVFTCFAMACVQSSVLQ